VILVKGPVEATIPQIIPNKIALVRLDTDWHASTLHAIEHLYPRLSSHGVLILDDYGHYKGARGRPLMTISPPYGPNHC
jgi:O-methyltransferase